MGTAPPICAHSPSILRQQPTSFTILYNMWPAEGGSDTDMYKDMSMCKNMHMRVV